MSSITLRNGEFADFDNENIYDESYARALKPSTRNFVVEFGKNEAQIAFDLEAEDIEDLLKVEKTVERPVRWM